MPEDYVYIYIYIYIIYIHMFKRTIMDYHPPTSNEYCIRIQGSGFEILDF